MVKATTKKAALTESDATETTAKSVAKKPSAKRTCAKKSAVKADSVPEAQAEVAVAEKPAAKKACAKRTCAKNSAVKADSVPEAPADTAKPAKNASTKKSAAKAALTQEAPADEAKPAKKVSTKKSAAKTAPAQETPADAAKPAKKSSTKKTAAQASSKKVAGGLFLLKVELSDNFNDVWSRNPHQVWRRILISGNKRFSDLHTEIQHAFDWLDDHLAGFFWDRPYGETISEIVESGAFVPNPKLNAKLESGMQIYYVFDFGDDWTHLITVEGVYDSEADVPQDLVWSEGESFDQYPDFED